MTTHIPSPYPKFLLDRSPFLPSAPSRFSPFIVLQWLSQSPTVTFVLRCDPCFKNQILFVYMRHLLFIALNFHFCLVSSLYKAHRRVQEGFEPNDDAVNFLKDVFAEMSIFAPSREETETETGSTLMS